MKIAIEIDPSEQSDILGLSILAKALTAASIYAYGQEPAPTPVSATHEVFNAAPVQADPAFGPNGEPPIPSSAPVELDSSEPQAVAPVQADPAFGPNGEPPIPSSAPVELDSSGLPWDARIHSETKNRNADGTWRVLRNLEKNKGEGYRAAIEAELRGESAIPVPAAPAAPAATPLPPAATDIFAPPPPPAVQAPAVPESPSGPATLSDLIMLIAKGFGNGSLSLPTLTGVLAPYGVTAAAQLSATPEHIPGVYAALQGIVGP